EHLANYVDAAQRTNYWKRPDVWADFQVSWEQYFREFPDAGRSSYHKYAWQAHRAEQWYKLNEIIPKLGSVDYAYFGGRDNYDEMVRRARDHLGEFNSDPIAPEIALRRVLMRLKGKLGTGNVTDADIAGELRELEGLRARFPEALPDFTARWLFSKARLYFEILGNPEAGRVAWMQLKQSLTNATDIAEVTRYFAEFTKQESATDTAPAIGSPFPEFTAQDLDGKPMSSSASKGSVVLVQFWATWSAPSVTELTNVLKTYASYHPHGFEVLGISLDYDRDHLLTFIKQRKIPWPQFCGDDAAAGKLLGTYGIQTIPANFLLDREGRIIGINLRAAQLEQDVRNAVGT